MRKRIFTLLMALCSIAAIEAQVRYVTENGEGDGTSWANASNDIQKMINELAEAGGGEIRVAQGNYVPTQKIAEEDVDGVATTERDKAFLLKSNISLYGGYAGTGNNPDERDMNVYTSVLNGAINNTERTYHIVIASGEDNIILDGFTIMNALCKYTNDNPKGENLGDGESFAGLKVNDQTFERGEGGGLFFRLCTNLYLGNLIVKENEALGCPAFTIADTDFVFDQSVIESNYALFWTSGAGIAHLSNSVFRNMTFRNNKAEGGTNGCPGALYVALGTLRIEDSIFEYNSSPREGALLISASAELERVYIRHNQGGVSGANLGAGALSVTSCTLKDVWITDNIGYRGAIALGSSPHIFENVVIERNISKIDANNEKSGYGGAIHYSWNGGSDGSLKLTNCKISNNISERGGGAIFAELGRNFNLDISNSEICNNQAALDGGAFYLKHVIFNNLNLNIDNTLISGNEVTGTETVVPTIFYKDNDLIKLNLVNTTIVNNKVTGSGYTLLDNSAVTLQNSILWGNLNGNNVESNIDAIASSTIANSLVGGFDLTATGGIDGTDPNITSKLIFSNYEEEDYSLLEWITNPVIDTGNSSFLSAGMDTDLAGRTRSYSQEVDMGAYEAQNLLDPFTGGIVNTTKERQFTYTGNEVNLSLNEELDATATFTWTCIDSDNNGETGNGLPVEGGIYKVAASLSGGNYDGETLSTIIRIEKADPTMTIETIPALLTGGSHELGVTFEETGLIATGITFTSSETTVASISGTTLSGIGVGTTVITATWDGDRNYNAVTVTQAAFVQDANDYNADIAGIRVNGIDAVEEGGIYKVTLPYTETATIEVITVSSTAIITGDSENSQVVTLGSGNTFSGTVKALSDAGITTSYTLEVSILNNNTAVSAISVNGQTTTLDGSNYTVTIPFCTNVTLTADPEDVNATVDNSTLSTSVFKGVNEHQITVIAEDGTKKNHTITIHVQNNAAYLSGITVNGTSATRSGQNYTVTLDPTTTAEITVSLLDNNSRLSGDQTGMLTVHAGENIFTYTVTSEDGTVENTYTLIVTVTDNDTSLSSVMVNGNTATFSNNRYNVTLPAGTISAQIVVTTNSATATVTGHGIKEVSGGTQTFTLTVTAEDGTVGTYDIVISVRDQSITDPSDPENPVTPDPNPARPLVSITGSLPEGVTIEPGIGNHTLAIGDTLTLTINLGDQYDEMRVYLVIDGDTVELQQVLRATSYTYTIENVTKDMTIEVVILDKDGNQVVSNAVIENGSCIRTVAGAVCIRTDKPDHVFIYSLQGKLIVQQRLTAGETTIALPEGLYVVALKNNVEKIIIRE